MINVVPGMYSNVVILEVKVTTEYVPFWKLDARPKRISFDYVYIKKKSPIKVFAKYIHAIFYAIIFK